MVSLLMFERRRLLRHVQQEAVQQEEVHQVAVRLEVIHQADTAVAAIMSAAVHHRILRHDVRWVLPAVLVTAAEDTEAGPLRDPVQNRLFVRRHQASEQVLEWGTQQGTIHLIVLIMDIIPVIIPEEPRARRARRVLPEDREIQKKEKPVFWRSSLLLFWFF